MPRRALIGAVLGAGLLVLAWYLTFHVAGFQHADESIYRHVRDPNQTHPDGFALAIAKLAQPRPYVYLVAIPVLIALISRRPAAVLAVVLVLAGANGTTRLLKPLLAHPRVGSVLGGISTLAPDSWPSGHATAATALALGFVLAVPGLLRIPMAILAAAFVGVASWAFLRLGWHYPSDVLAGFLVASTWALLGLAAMTAVNQRYFPGSQSGSSSRFAPRLRMNSRSESRLR